MPDLIPLVSVIIPTYGRPAALADAVASVRTQTYRNIEIVVVDDNPPDSKNRQITRKLIQSLPGGDIPVIYVELPHNMGASSARNEGVNASQGSLITFLDDDDVYLPKKVELQVSDMDEGTDICACSMYAIEDGYDASAYVCTHPIGSDLAEFILDGSIFTPMIMVRRHIFLKVGGFTPTPRFQDQVLMLKLLDKSTRYKISTTPLYIHNLHLGERVTFSAKIRTAFQIKHELECKLATDCLSDEKFKSLLKRQELERYDCDLFEQKGFQRLSTILSKIIKASSPIEAIFLIGFSIKKSLRKSILVWRIRRFLFSRKIVIGKFSQPRLTS